MSALPLAAFIEAQVRLLPAEQGGRRAAIWSGYRCNCWLGHLGVDGDRVYNDATFHLLDGFGLSPGQAARVRVQPHHPGYWSRLEVGDTFELCEGARRIGEAVVVELFPDR